MISWMRIRACVSLALLLLRAVQPFSVGRSSLPTHTIATVAASTSTTRTQQWRLLTSFSSRTTTSLFVAQQKASYVPKLQKKLDDAEKGAGVEGAQYFGGNKKKEDLFDPVAEKNADIMISKDGTSTYQKFRDTNAFPDALAGEVALAVQSRLNGCLYVEEQALAATLDNFEYAYSPTMEWVSPFTKENNARTPLDGLKASLEFYNRVDVAVTSGKQLSDNVVELRWEISVAWPIFWEPRILLTGTSKLTLSDGDKQIVKQVDALDGNGGLLGRVRDQFIPRFFDFYHIGMSPSCELSPKFKQRSPNFFAPYSLHKVPPRLVYRPSLINALDRDDGVAESLPNHGFTCAIKTVGPFRQRYVTASPMEVQIQPDVNIQGKNRITWTLPLTVEVQTNQQQPLPGYDEETNPDWFPTSRYEFMSERLVATLPYGGLAQDEEIADLRKRLYEAVIKDGFKPKLDETSGRPIFFFWEQRMKMCYISDGGLGMAIHHWRPRFVATNAVGIELEHDA